MNIFNIIMRWISTVIGMLMIGLGGIWILQGLNIAPAPVNRGFMIGDPQWTIYGLILGIVGIAQVIWSHTRQAR